MGKVKLAGLPRGFSSFTLVELLVVMAIISILVALSLAAGNTLWNMAKRNRAHAEIAAMNTALESYKTDNGIYPAITNIYPTSTYVNNDGTTVGGVYQQSSQSLYQALTGKINFLDLPNTNAKSYMEFKVNQLGNNAAPPGTSGSGSTYIRDPWTYSYAYAIGDGTTNNPPYNGYGFFDLWSTAGTTTAKPNTNAWINNWSQ